MNWATVTATLAKCLPSYTHVIAGVVCFTIGHTVATTEAEKEAAAQELAHAVALADQGKRDYEKIVRAQNTADELRAIGASYRSDLERMRKQIAARRAKPSAPACTDERAAVARCERLLGEGTDLLAEGADLLRGNAAVHDGVLTLLAP